MKTIILICLLLGLGFTVTITDTDTCSVCTELKSQKDCESTDKPLGCEWKNSACAAKAVVPPETFKAYCDQVADPTTKCAKTYGCAYVDQKTCTHFTGCTAYVKTTLSECQAISYLCITNGVTCTDVLECDKYLKQADCEANPSPWSPYKCKWDSDACRNWKCTEADTTYTTDKQCSDYKAGCVTTGQGCSDAKLPCNQYTGTADTCVKMIGNLGNYCAFDSGTACKERVCAEAKLTTFDDASCAAYKSGCKSTGFSCVDSWASCTTYDTNGTNCQTYKGSEGWCAVDAAATKCRARKCEDKVSGVLKDCTDYLGGCLTNGVTCVTTLKNCNQYNGTKSTCKSITGLDGKCKGTSDTDSTVACALRTCADDDLGTETTDTACLTVQSGCKTTGAGCVSSLPSCTTYTDDNAGSCLKMTGSEGKCKAGTGGKCAAKACTDNTTATSNTACNDFKTGCVTTGLGCAAQGTCADVVKQVTCEGSTTNSCGWTPICVSSTSCASLSTKSLCSNYKAGGNPCFWDNGCRLALCSDFTAADDTTCNTLKNGCVTNGTKCADPANCSTEFTGIKATCEGYTAKCTNDASAVATANCKSKSCTDTITAASDSDCSQYLSDCLFAGTDKCVLKTAGCTGYSGTKEECDKFTGYVNSTSPRVKCYNDGSATCVNKQCSQATGMTSDTDCSSFLDGCIYNGGDSCVTANAGCTSYKYKTNASECRAFKGTNGTVPCYDGTSNNCKVKECSDETSTDSDTDGECSTFLGTCVYNGKPGTRCVPETDDCDTFKGTSDQCNALTRNKQQCTRTEACKGRVCSDKTNATSNSDCTSYLPKCRLVQGSTNCKDSEAACASYALTSTTDAQTYCNTVTTTNDAATCSFDSGTTANCVPRACKYWVSSLTVPCVDYKGKNSCVLANTSYCYEVGACTSYSIPSSVTTGQAAWCNNLKSSDGYKCTFVSGSTCAAIASCETVPSPTKLQDCYDFSGQVCAFYSGKCISIQTACTGYSLASITDAAVKSTLCYSLKSNNSGTIKYCAYQTATTGTCVERTCDDILSPTSQASCSSVTGCTYYSGKCYTKKACGSYSFPQGVTDHADRRVFCQNMTSNTDADLCSYDPTGNSNAGLCAATKACTGYTGAAVGDCTMYRDTDGTVCTWKSPDTTCSKAADAAAACTTVTTATSDYYCDVRTLVGCHNVGGTCTVKACSDLAGTDVATCQALKGAGGIYCTWTTGTKCEDGKTNCAAWSGADYKSIAACSPLKDKNGKSCTWLTGTTCADLTCEDVVSPVTVVDCQVVESTCKYYMGYCIKDEASCSGYVAKGATDADKLAYCNGRVYTDGSGGSCTYVTGIYCVDEGACSTYDVSTIASTSQVAACKAMTTTDANGCTHFAGDNCSAIKACADYTGYGAGDAINYCSNYKTSTGLTCTATAANSTACISPATCDDIASPTNQASCDKYLTGCFFNSSTTKCVAVGACTDYDTPASGAIAFCKGVKDSAGNFCTATANDNLKCATRACNDADALYLNTNADCKAYSNLCKSDGFGCILASTTCALQSGIIQLKTCEALLDENGSSCAIATADANTAACKIKACGDNITAVSQVECDGFITGGSCRWINPGCTAKTTPCSQYRGTQAECGNFIGNGKICWSDSQSKGACRDKRCDDKSTATNDGDCSTFLTGCVFNGAGCVAKGSACSAFRGTKDTCSSFDLNSSVPCYSLSATVGSCIDRICTHLTTGTKDSDCEAFLPGKKCITDGTSCQQGPKACSYFKGNADTCPTFTSSEGICKKGLSGYCAKRECYEAPNNLTKDSQCNDWSPGCVTNGRGCTSSVNCQEFQNQSTCAAVTGCQWASSCRAGTNTCSSLTSSTACVNNPKKCAWYNGTCREPTCVDLDATLTTHILCSGALTGCTTTGAGCIAQGLCTSYTTKTMCEAAEANDTTKKCTWSQAACRTRRCGDLSGTSDEACDAFLTGCKTTGTTCVGSPYSCSVFSGNQKYCVKDSNGNPCLYVEGVCYNYNDCTDASPPTRTYCKSFSSNCVVGSTTCIALNQCSEYKTQISCYSGINGSTCGWLPSQACDEFNASNNKGCSFATGTTLADCKAWNTSCVSDGSACVPIGDCTSYLKQQSCENNYDAASNACFWTGTACKLKQCSDVTATTDTDCVANIVKEGLCTTDGTKCVVRAACTAYASEGACTVGADGIPCTFNFPVGQTTGTKTCRAQECQDIIGTTNDACIGKINKKPCVSNSKNCVAQGTCASYKNKLSCQAGGSDNAQCVFTAVATTADPNAGSCVAFTSCANGNGDKVTCLSNKSCKYTDATSKCETTDCATFNGSGTCKPFPSFDGKTFTICTTSTTGCVAGDPTGLATGDCYSTVSKYTYTWNASTNKCQSCKGQSSSGNNSSGGNNTNNDTTTDSGYVLGVSMALALLGFMA